MATNRPAIGLIDLGDKLPNLALMKLSAHYKRMGYTVYLDNFTASQVDQVFCSVVFSKDRQRAANLRQVYPDISFGGPGWDVQSCLPEEIESCKPDYDLYTAEHLARKLKGRTATRLEKARTIVNSGMGYSTRGCPNECGFCLVPQKEGKLRQVAEIKDLLNPRSKVLTLLDNNLCGDPLAIEKLAEIRQRDLTVNITQGIDVRLLSDELAMALAQVKHFSSVHYAWDQPHQERSIFEGVTRLARWIKPRLQTCFVLCGYNSSFEEDMMRVRKLHEAGVRPYIMAYNFNEQGDLRLHHFKRYVNQFFYKRMGFEEYQPWAKARPAFEAGSLF